jgi:hypothetical protein
LLLGGETLGGPKLALGGPGGLGLAFWGARGAKFHPGPTLLLTPKRTPQPPEPLRLGLLLGGETLGGPELALGGPDGLGLAF